jgi:hypothetical protein
MSSYESMNCNINPDRHYNYNFKFKLFESSDITTYKQEIKFKTFGELNSYLIPGTKVKFIITCLNNIRRELTLSDKKLIKKLSFSQRQNKINELMYYVTKIPLLVHSIEITKKQYVNFDYDYEYIQQKLNKQLKLDIIASRYTPDKIIDI